MDQLYKIAGTVMGFFDAFKGSRPAIDNKKILIVRGRSRKVIPIDDLNKKLEEVGKELGASEVTNADKISDILELGDKQIQSTETVTGVIDSSGFMKMKQELETLGLVAAYKVFEVPGCNIVIAIWEDKNEVPPLYVEVTVSRTEG
ncbi:MAG: DUF2120 family protein [Methanobrevibacter sp.]|uniref:DUF2120 family protein n=1 Tax=Methanobrevibacter sp. TaxID=66852 RepID=UPI0026E0D66B|nr:DUF2120 family protein [Methanobrevibacter sp.]MDO5848113.1 DUF2120 family protein [Methanobrevibacter sp.]